MRIFDGFILIPLLRANRYFHPAVSALLWAITCFTSNMFTMKFTKANFTNCLLEFIAGWAFFHFIKQFEDYSIPWFGVLLASCTVMLYVL